MNRGHTEMSSYTSLRGFPTRSDTNHVFHYNYDGCECQTLHSSWPYPTHSSLYAAILDLQILDSMTLPWFRFLGPVVQN